MPEPTAAKRKEGAGKPALTSQSVVGFAVVVGTIWLGWQTITAPVVDRAAPAFALRLAPTSPEVLRRAAEAELMAGQVEDARVLSNEALARRPFNARALRVRGLAEAKEGSTDLADQMLTLAGNWSLRDDPAHAWLVEHRLRRGDYRSAFAHADTLARRRPDMFPTIFNLFTTAAVQDPRALSVITRLVAADPPWRSAYLESLHRTDAGAQVVSSLAIALERTDAPFSNVELQQLYETWLGARRFGGLRQLRSHLQRPAIGRAVQNGDFSTEANDQVYPFGWRLGAGAGITTTVVEDDLKAGNQAFRLQYDGYGNDWLLAQVVLLDPGEYVLSGVWRAETPDQDAQVKWILACADGDFDVNATGAEPFTAATTEWRSFRSRLVVPRENCSTQWLRLVVIPGDRRTSIGAWFDNIEIRPAAKADVARGAGR